MTRRGGNKGTNREGTVVTAAAAVDACELLTLSLAHARVCIALRIKDNERSRRTARAVEEREKERRDLEGIALSLPLAARVWRRLTQGIDESE